MTDYLNFFVTNIETIIEVSFAVIVVLIAFLLFLLSQSSRREEESIYDRLEKSLKRLLENAPRTLAELPPLSPKEGNLGSALNAGIPEDFTSPSSFTANRTAASSDSSTTGASSSSASSGAASGVSSSSSQGATSSSQDAIRSEIEEKLRQRERQIQALEAELSKAKEASAKDQSASAAGPAVDPNPELKKKLKDLEEKLAEYEIIEDDIADLALFKQENSRLKQELDEYKTKFGDMSSAPNLVQEIQEDPLMAEFEAAVSEQKQAAAAPAPSAQPIAADSDDILKEFEKAVANQLLDQGEETPAPPLVAQETQETPDLEDTAIDTEKMMQELAGAAEAADSKVLEEDVDTERMAMEAGKLHGS